MITNRQKKSFKSFREALDAIQKIREYGETRDKMPIRAYKGDDGRIYLTSQPRRGIDIEAGEVDNGVISNRLIDLLAKNKKRKVVGYHKVTPEVMSNIVRLSLDGYNLQEIASRLGVSYMTVSKEISKWLKFRPIIRELKEEMNG